MAWSAEEHGREIVASTVVATLNLGTATDVWRRIREFLREQRAGWDFVRAEYWSEGRWVIYPARSNAPHDRVDNICCNVYVADLREEEARLDQELLGDDDDLDADGRFTESIVEMTMRSAQRLLAGAGAIMDVPVRVYDIDDHRVILAMEPAERRLD